MSIDDRTKAIQEGVREALREHALLGRSVSIWQDGRIVWLTPAEILEELRRTEQPNTSANGTAQDHHD
ncbi:MAG: hypothetical protein J2P46_13950 [Zavarzinella sp.]|nr:hypothetical protein [Zavarzinella sp.]